MRFTELVEARNPKYRKNPAQENFMERLNRALAPLEEEMQFDGPLKMPVIFVVGVPRSGTTITTQILSQGLDVGYVNNLAARFWMNPLIGVRFAEQVLGNKRESTFASEYASTGNLTDIHEFGYFWRYHLKLSGIEDILARDFSDDRINWEELIRSLSSLQHYFGKPMVFKNIFGAYCMGIFASKMPTLWVNVERNPMDNALGVLRARRNILADPSIWWSTVPLDYDELKGLTPHGQVAGQVATLRQFYRKELDGLPTANRFDFAYDDLCRSPKDVLTRLSAHVKEHFNYDIALTDYIPERLEVRNYDRSSEDAVIMRMELDKYGL
jgi:hypothetical protein